jgi:hypothetical protein
VLLATLDALNRRMDAYDKEMLDIRHADEDGDDGEDPDKQPIKQDGTRKKDMEMDSAARADAEITIGKIYIDADRASSAWGNDVTRRRLPSADRRAAFLRSGHQEECRSRCNFCRHACRGGDHPRFYAASTIHSGDE